MTVPTTAWNEASIADADPAAQLGVAQRLLKLQLREIIAVDHVMSSSGQGTTWGMHDVVQMIEQSSAPSNVSDTVQLYGKDDGDGVIEFFLKDGDGNEIQVTDGGGLNAISITGSETITGAKTFSGGLTVATSNLALTSYTTGAVNVTNGNANVVGVGTTFTDLTVGELFHVDGDDQCYTITSITDATHLALTGAYQGATAIGASYEIVPGVDGRYLAKAANVGELTAAMHAASLAGNLKVVTYSGAASPAIAFGFKPDVVVFLIQTLHSMTFAVRTLASGDPEEGPVHVSVNSNAIGTTYASVVRYTSTGITILKEGAAHAYYNQIGYDYVAIGLRVSTGVEEANAA